MPSTSDREKKIFFHKTPMLIKAENNTKSDLHSFKSKMSRGQSLKNQGRQNSLIMRTHTVVLTNSVLN